MKIVRGLVNDQLHFALDRDGVYHRIEGNIYGKFDITNEPIQFESLITPIPITQIIGIGLNYRAHAAELGVAPPQFPIVFGKGLNTLTGHNTNIILPTTIGSDKVDYEAELGVVIGQACKNVSEEDALNYVLGYTCVNDVSARDWQIEKGGGQWMHGKSFDSFAPTGPCLASREVITNPDNLEIIGRKNGEVVQRSNTSDLIFSVRKIISFLSASTTLIPGTLILTGTPAGVGMSRGSEGFLKEGDEFSVEIEGIGVLSNKVVLEER